MSDRSITVNPSLTRTPHESEKGKHHRGRKRRRSPTFVSRIIGIVRFGGSFQYVDPAHWRDDQKSHRIPEGSCFDWQPNTTPEMYGWNVTSAQALVVPQQGPDKKGMIGCKAITRVAVLRNEVLSDARQAQRAASLMLS